jgi:hypothetical protein
LPKKKDLGKYWEEDAAWYSKLAYRKTPMQRLVGYERQRGTTEWYALLEEQTGRTWHEKGLMETTSPTERSYENGPL